MLTLSFLLVFLLIVAACWFLGLWSNILILINLLLAGTIATNFYEPVADKVEQNAGEFTYLIDFIVIWILFVVSFVGLRLASDMFSRVKVNFNIWVEMVGRSILSIWVAWVFICFSFFTLHMAPLPPNAVQASPEAGTFLGMSPDSVWLAYAQSRSRGALSRGHFTGSAHPDDGNTQTFDPQSDHVFKYQSRRARFSQLDDFRVSQ